MSFQLPHILLSVLAGGSMGHGGVDSPVWQWESSFGGRWSRTSRPPEAGAGTHSKHCSLVASDVAPSCCQTVLCGQIGGAVFDEKSRDPG